jgi:pSer/pThr/pTyr-binding forkhead associated (FHA) protein
MAKLVVNPNSTAAWEIELKPGPNFLGRGFANDFKIDDPSVSGSHCQILVDQGNILIKDLGSTNGTFVNRAPVHEANLRPGQTIHLGGVELFFQPDTPTVTLTKAGIARAESSPPIVAAPTLPPPIPAVTPGPAGAVAPGSQNCKFHPKTPGRFYCNKCVRYFCEICVTSRGQHKYCRHCGAECVAVQVQIARPAPEKGFFRRLPGAFVYPFKGFGVMMLILVALLDSGSGFLG